METISTYMRTAELLNYREFDRVANPAPVTMFSCNDVESIKKWMSTTTNIVPLEIAICGNKALLVDGNHRVAAANILNIENLPVIVTYYNSVELNATFYTHTIERFKIIN